MSDLRCPRDDRSNWRPQDVYTVRCPDCDAEVEFFDVTETSLACPSCGKRVANPKKAAPGKEGPPQ